MHTAPLRVLVAGGGVAGLETMLALHALAGDRVDVELLAAEPHFWYRPLAVAEPFAAARVHRFELADLAEACRARFTLGRLDSVEPERRVVRTTCGVELGYDALVLAHGARPEPTFAGALTFRGPADTDAFRAVLGELADGGRLVFTVADGAAWPLPAYELALLTAAQLRPRPQQRLELALVTPEERPLALFGPAASDAVERLLEERGIALHAGRRVVASEGGRLRLAPDGAVPFDRVVALPRLRGEPVSGVPADEDGFVVTDAHGRVLDVEGVYAAGDATAFPVKQGGLAAQQADAVAESIAAHAGAPVRPRPFRPVLRGLLLTGGPRTYLRAGPGGSAVATEPLWWPPAKIVGRHLAPFLAEQANLPVATVRRPGRHVAVDVDLAAGA